MRQRSERSPEAESEGSSPASDENAADTDSESPVSDEETAESTDETNEELSEEQ